MRSKLLHPVIFFCSIKIILVIAISIMSFATTAGQTLFRTIEPGITWDDLLISSTCEDRYGQMWMTHRSGCLIFDGHHYQTVTYKEIFGVDFSEDRGIKTYHDGKGNIWITSLGGEVTLIKEKDNYYSIKSQFISKSKKYKYVSSMFNETNTMYFGDNEGKIYQFDYSTKKVKELYQLNRVGNKSQEISGLWKGNDTNLYISTLVGKFYKLDIKSGNIQEITLKKNIKSELLLAYNGDNALWLFSIEIGMVKYDLTSGEISEVNNINSGITKNIQFTCLTNDHKNNIWLGTDGHGLFRIEALTGKINHFESDAFNKMSLQNNTIISINKDKNNNIWVVLKEGVIQVASSSNDGVNYHSGSSGGSPQKILSIYLDSKKNIWMGSDGHGLSYHKKNGQSLLIKDANIKYIQAIAEGSNGDIWFGTYQNGLWIYNTALGKLTKVHLKNKLGEPITDTRTIYKDRNNRMWVSTTLGIFLLNTNGKVLDFYDVSTDEIVTDISQSIVEDKLGNLWVAVNGRGVFKVLLDNPNIQSSNWYYVNVEDSTDSKHNYNIIQMATDTSGNMWMITRSGSLLSVNSQNNQLTSFRRHEILSGYILASIQISIDNKVWLGSNKGLLKFDVVKNTVELYNPTDGFQNDYVRRSSFKDEKGKFYFGGQLGINYFNPMRVTKKRTNPCLLINSIEVLNQSFINVLSTKEYSNFIETGILNLNHEQSSFSFRFVALDNLLFPHFRYQYRLKGFSDQWIESSRELIATYTNIPHGNYTFEVKALDSRTDLHNLIKSVKIKIAPPWWLSKFALFFYFFLISCFLFLIYKGYTTSQKLAKEEWERIKNKEIYDMKMNFFTKMSHEIQTPLTLILGPIQELKHYFEGNKQWKKKTNIIFDNARRISRITADLTAARDIELGVFKLRLQKGDIIDNVREISHSFEEYAISRKLKFSFQHKVDTLYMVYDKEVLDHILYNLLSNAFKFSPLGGSIEISVSEEEHAKEVSIIVTDQGPGIQEYEIEKIFQPFYQTSHGYKNKGLGIGLALTRELVSLHQGRIEVSSAKDTGTKFKVILPSDLTENISEIIEVKNTKTQHQDLQINSDPLIENYSGELPKLLIVEDNHQMQEFLLSVFSSKYHVILADDGAIGVEIAKNQKPNVIVSDVMMPNMSGLEMSRILKKDKSTRHIPIILISAKNQENVKIEGLEAGAIDFVFKPFNITELIHKVENHILKDFTLKEKTRNDLLINVSNVIESHDETFIKKLVALISVGCENEQFSLEEVANEMSMSYSTLYRRCSEITGKSLVEFSTLVKLKKALTLFTSKGYSIAEASYKCGFNDPKYFSKCFKKYYGISPKDVLMDLETQDIEYIQLKYDLIDV